MKVLWVVGAGPEAVPGIKRAKALGLHVVASDGNPLAPGFQLADERITVSTYDVEQTVRMAKAYTWVKSIDGVIAMCADVPATVAAVAEALGLPGLPPDVARLGADKLAMKERLLEKGVQTAWGCVLESGGQLRRLLLHRGGPLVVKPVDSRGARGVIRIADRPGGGETVHNLKWAFDEAKRQSPTGRVLVEEWLTGPQLSTEAILCSDGTAFAVALDRNYTRLEEFAPYVIEDGADGPTRLPWADEEPLLRAFIAAAKAVVGTTPCTVKGDMVLTKDGPKVVELALRLSGGYMSTELIPRMCGVDFVGTAIRLALGEAVTAKDIIAEAPSRPVRGVAIRFKIPPRCQSHPQRRGHAIAEADTREEAVKLAEDMIATGNYEGASARVV